MGFNDLRKKDAPEDTSGVGTLTAFIDEGSEFTGKVSFKGTVRIDGRFEGEISSQNTLIVGETGVIKAPIRSKVVIIFGEVQGDILAEARVVLHKTANVVGDLFTGSLMMEPGAQFKGRVEMKAAAAAHAPID